MRFFSFYFSIFPFYFYFFDLCEKNSTSCLTFVREGEITMTGRFFRKTFFRKYFSKEICSFKNNFFVLPNSIFFKRNLLFFQKTASQQRPFKINLFLFIILILSNINLMNVIIFQMAFFQI